MESAFLQEKQTYILTVLNTRDEIVAVLPLALSRNRLGGTVGRFLGSRFNPDPLGLICKAEHLTAAAAAIRRYFKEEVSWDQILIDWVTREECVAWEAGRVQQSVAPYLPLNEGIDGLVGGFKRQKKIQPESRRKTADGRAQRGICVV
ncbi:hypothetical protein [Marinobacter sp. X15-166B]|uniref:hypothetical protein n=1 Tax=Marinobacter sp. X15-166B TaxID=1897620 RepID=UPI00085BD6AB|nr:hypothetical protein [Marinobacter sp. X15-166B]OEY67757.1 hypothetical protein BG841_15855 [Marinobacter sp. X15-166B]